MSQKEIICSTCHIKFGAVINYKLHLATEYHVYNTKRRMADLAPITEEVFELKKSEMISANASAITELGYKCQACCKSFKSLEKLEEHKNTKKHKKNEKDYLNSHPGEDSVIKSFSHHPMGSVASEVINTENILDELKTLESGKYTHANYSAQRAYQPS